MPSQKFGVDRPHSANTLAACPTRCRGPPPRRCRPGCRSRARSSSPSPPAAASPAASAASGRAPAAACAATRRGRPAAHRRPSRRSAPAAVRPGAASRAGSAMTVGSRSSPASICAGSPGSSCCSPKISIETKISVGTICASRLSRNSSIGGLGVAAQFSFRPVTRSRPSGTSRTPRELGVVGPQPVAVVQVDDRAAPSSTCAATCS